jgi:hypothetical protein
MADAQAAARHHAAAEPAGTVERAPVQLIVHRMPRHRAAAEDKPAAVAEDKPAAVAAVDRAAVVVDMPAAGATGNQ